MNKFMISRRLLLAGVAATTITSAPATSQTADYPNRPIKIVVPLPPGAGPDVVARMLAEKLSVKFGQPVIVENRPGGSLNLGAQIVAKAKPDGYTLLVTPPAPLVYNQYLFANIGFDPAAFEPVSLLSKSTFVLVARADLPVATLPELAAYASAHPDKLTIANGGRGSSMELIAEMLKGRAGIKLVNVPYPGNNLSFTDLIGGRVDLAFTDLGNARAQLDSGALKSLGVASQSRLPELPNTPAIAETFPGFAANVNGFMVAPPKTPAEITKKLSDAVVEALRSPDIVAKMNAIGIPPIGTTPSEAAKVLTEETALWRRVIEIAGMRPE
jgi:tripartite-type tricarboxylate transporter receptor subunit TctC